MSQFQYQGKGLLQTTGRNMGLTATQLNAINGANLGSINLAKGSNVNGVSITSLNNINWIDSESLASGHEHLKKYEVYETSESLLTLSVTAHRMYTDMKIYYKLTERDLFQKITPEDRVMADQIKDYYSKKLMMWKLKTNGKLSSFREDMNKLIHSDMLMFKEKMIGVAYWLPRFYQYDIEMDLIKMNLTKDQSFDKLNKEGKPLALKLTDTLIPIKSIERKTKHSNIIEYWFKDETHNAGVLIKLGEKNQLQHIWDRLFNQKQPMKIEGTYCRRKLDDFEYYSITGWNLVED